MPASRTYPILHLSVTLPLLLVASLAAAQNDGPGKPPETANAQDPNDNRPPAMTRDDALREDARRLAASAGIPLGQALKSLRAQEDSQDIVDELRREFGGRVAGVHVVHNPDYKVVVRLKGAAAPSKRMLNRGGSDIPIEFVTGAESTAEEQVAAYSARLDQIRAILPTVQGVGTDEKTGEVAIIVTATGPAALAARGKRDDLVKLLGHPVRIETVEQETRDSDIRGGAKVATATGSSYCTSGFSVKNASNVTAMTTASHCEGMKTYYNTNGTTIGLTFVTETKDADQDVEIHTSGFAELGQFYADSTTTARTLTGKRLRSSTAAGNQVCHRGVTTGYSCGTVSLTNYQPTYAGACGTQTCSAVWVKVDGDSTTACDQGDSGGPVFASQTAFGLLKATNDSGSGAGQCSFFIYMSTDYLPTGWNLIYG